MDETLLGRYQKLFGQYPLIGDEELFREHFSVHVGKAIIDVAMRCGDEDRERKLKKLATLFIPNDSAVCKSFEELIAAGFDEPKFYQTLSHLLGK